MTFSSDENRDWSVGLEERLKTAYGTKNLAEIAGKLGVSYQALNHYLRGRHSITADRLLVIFSDTGCSLHWLLTGDGPMLARDIGIGGEAAAEVAVENYLFGQWRELLARQKERGNKTAKQKKPKPE